MPVAPAPVELGVAGMGTEMGSAQAVAEEADRLQVACASFEHLGYRTLRRADDDATATTLGVAAARRACDDAGVDLGDVQHVVLAAGATVPDYLNWDPSTDVTRVLGIPSVPTSLLTQGCASGVLGLEYVAGLLAVQPTLETVLFIAADRVSERHVRRIGATADSDGAAALVLRRGHDRFRWRATAQITDARYTEFFRLEFCGRAAACGGDPSRNSKIPPALRVFEHFREDPEAFTAWAELVDRRVVEALDEACRRAGVNRADVARLLLLHDSQPSIRAITAVAGVDLSRTNAQLAADLGHFGGSDPLISLHALRDAAEVRPGDLVALAGMSSGMHWFCTLVEA